VNIWKKSTEKVTRLQKFHKNGMFNSATSTDQKEKKFCEKYEVPTAVTMTITVCRDV